MFTAIRNMKIKSQMLVLTGIFTLSMTILGVFLFYNINTVLNSKIESSSMQVFSHIEMEILNSVSFYENTADTIAYNASTQKMLNKNFPVDEYEYYKDVDSMTVSFFNADKNIAAIYMMFNYRMFAYGNSAFDLEFLKEIRLNNNETCYTPLLSSTDFNLSSIQQDSSKTDRFFAVVRRLNSTDDLFSDNYYGNIALVIYTSLLDEICSRYAITENSRIFIVNNHMQIAGRETFAEEKLYPEELVVSIARDPSGYSDFRREHTKYMSMVHPIGDTGWNAVMIIPKREYFSELDGITSVTVLIAALLLIIIGVFSTLIIKSVTSPINSLLKAMENVGKGNLKFRIPLLLKNETGKLAEHFNIMMNDVYNLTGTIVANQKMLYEAELINKDARLKALQSQINPHFLYNTLACMRSIARKYGADEILEMSSALAKVLRYSIREDDFVLVSAELENLKDYIRIYQINLSGKFDFILNVNPEIMGCKIIKLILQPIVENALNHGIMNSVNRCKLTINGCLSGNRIRFEIIDDGKGISKEKLELLNREITGSMDEYARENLGIMNVKQRLKLCYGNDYSFFIESSENKGTRVCMEIPGSD